VYPLRLWDTKLRLWQTGIFNGHSCVIILFVVTKYKKEMDTQINRSMLLLCYTPHERQQPPWFNIIIVSDIYSCSELRGCSNTKLKVILWMVKFGWAGTVPNVVNSICRKQICYLQQTKTSNKPWTCSKDAVHSKFRLRSSHPLVYCKDSEL
jgi:hypothetical protein